MKLNKLLFPSLLLSVALAHGQQVPAPPAPESPESEPVGNPPVPDLTAPGEVDPSAPPFNAPGDDTPIGAPALPGGADFPDVPPPPPPPPEGEVGVEGEPPVDPGQIEAANGGFLIRDAHINDIFQMLAKRAGKQYFHNAKIAGPEFTVSGSLNGGDPLEQMEDLAFMHGLKLYQK
jgi:hypothetical protein